MKYISDIKVNGKPVDYFEYPSYLDADIATITTYDMNIGATEEVIDCDFSATDCYGFGIGPGAPIHYFARHTNLTVQLYKYIRWVKTYYGPSIPSGSADACVSDMQDAPSRVLEIYCGNNVIYLLGPCGSSVVVIYDDYDFVKAFSLYDFLISMCRTIDLNIMAYGAVRFFDFEEDRCTEIAFSHEDEAQKFFSKMYVMGTPKVIGGQFDKTIWPWVSDRSNLIVTTHDMESSEERSFQDGVRRIDDI